MNNSKLTSSKNWNIRILIKGIENIFPKKNSDTKIVTTPTIPNTIGAKGHRHYTTNFFELCCVKKSLGQMVIPSQGLFYLSSQCSPSVLSYYQVTRRKNTTHIDLPFNRGHVIVGVFIEADAVIKISCRRGMPSVTFISPRPAWWNVFNLKFHNHKVAKAHQND